MSSRPAIPDRVLTVVAGSCVALFGFLPVANWIPGGRSWPEYGTTVQHWLAGSAIAFGVAALARAVLLPLAAESLHVVRSPFSADSTERVLPGTVYGARCVQRVQEDRAGFTVYLPLTVIDGDDVIYARDLHAREFVAARAPSGSHGVSAATVVRPRGRRAAVLACLAGFAARDMEARGEPVRRSAVSAYPVPRCQRGAARRKGGPCATVAVRGVSSARCYLPIANAVLVAK